MLAFPEAERLLRGLPARARAAWVGLDAAGGRVAAQEVRAPEALPRAPRSAMDGYALRTADLAADAAGVGAGAATLVRAGALYAGDVPGRPLPPGGCVAVATGAPLPPGADAVAPREWTRMPAGGTGAPDTVCVLRAPAPGQNVVAPGEEGRAGAVLLRAGQRVGPRQLAALAAYGVARLRVRRRLRVALLATGDELAAVGGSLRPGQVYESTVHPLEAELRRLGAQVRRLAPCGDRPAELEERFGQLLAGARWDAVLSTGGVSVGERDLVRTAWERLGAVCLFWRVAVKPGRALYAACAGDTWVFALSGNPHAALAAFYALVRPALEALAGAAPEGRRVVRLEAACTRRRDATRLVWAERGGAPGGARPLEGLSVLETLTRAEALLVVPPGPGALAAGAEAEAVPLDRGWAP